MYKHTQIGYLMIIIAALVSLYFGFIFTKIGMELLFVSIALLVIFIIISFSTLNVVIDSRYLRIRFGYGIYRKRFLLKDISSVKSVKNHWYFGWGIRVWFWPYMWIYNVSGFDAVEIRMKHGRIYRIGTDEPKKLKKALVSQGK